MLKILLETIVKCLFYSTVGSKIQLLLHYIFLRKISVHMFLIMSFISLHWIPVL